jgi:hypothetical protein
MFHNVPWIIALIVCIINAVVSTVVLAADIALVLVARSRLASVTQVDLTINWGNGVWMVLAAVVCTWISLILLSVTVCRCCGRRYVALPWSAISAVGLDIPRRKTDTY